MTNSDSLRNQPRNQSTTLAPRGKAVVLCVLLIITGGVAHGYLDSRWMNQKDVEAQVQILQQLPEKSGDWVRVTDDELQDAAQRTLQCYGSLLQEYLKPATGDRVKVFVVYGPRGPIAVHTPEVCYSSAGTEPTGNRVATTLLIDGQAQALWKVNFRKPRTNAPPHLEVWYGWSDGGPWKASAFPRAWFTDSLFKIQVAGQPAKTSDEISPVEDFLRSFLPTLERAGIGSKRNEAGTQ
ncbi:MAG: exosortase-associated EpsI family protein [Rubripirellula sp.]|nr:exosortase-associated EpsI family protein [Rubripirellula sp.]